MGTKQSTSSSSEVVLTRHNSDIPPRHSPRERHPETLSRDDFSHHLNPHRDLSSTSASSLGRIHQQDRTLPPVPTNTRPLPPLPRERPRERRRELLEWDSFLAELGLPPPSHQPPSLHFQSSPSPSSNHGGHRRRRRHSEDELRGRAILGFTDRPIGSLHDNPFLILRESFTSTSGSN